MLKRVTCLEPLISVNSCLFAVLILLFSFFQTTVFAVADNAAPEIYTPSEKKRLASASKSPDNRIRVYTSASERIRKEIEKDIREGRFEDAERTFYIWSALLSESLADIEANVNPKRKSNRLRHYEIHLRQALSGMRAPGMRVPTDLYDTFTSFMEQAEEIRSKLINILFDME